VQAKLKELRQKYDKTEDDLKALQSVGQMIGEVLRQLDDERFIVKGEKETVCFSICFSNLTVFFSSFFHFVPSLCFSLIL
jgi:ATP-dependent 26S proteasome regulatory subunit